MNLKEQIENYKPYNEQEALRIKEDENNDVKWINIEDVENEKWVLENVYKKLNKKLKEGKYAK